MSDSTTQTVENCRFPKLNDVNYVEWAMHMEADLVRRKLWDGIVEITLDGDVQDPSQWQEEYEKKKMKRSVQRMNEARAEMIMQVDDGQLSHMRSRDPMEIWEMLAKVHKARGFATQLAMKRQFLTSKKKPTQSMQAWIGEIRSMAFRMEETGIAVVDQDKILAVTMGLPPSYDAVIIALDSIPTEQLTLEEVIRRLLNQEVRQTSAYPPSPSAPTPDDGVAAAVLSTEKPKVDRSKVQCYFCDQMGHFKQDCAERAKWEAARRKTKTSGSANTAMSAGGLSEAYEELTEVDGAW